MTKHANSPPLLLTFISLFFLGCLKDSKEPETHVNDVKVSLVGTWTQSYGIVKYYDAENNEVYSSGVPLVDLYFEDESAVLLKPDSAMSYSGNYSVVTAGLTDYINIAANGMSLQFAIQAISTRNLALQEIKEAATSDTLRLASGNVLYKRSIQTNRYLKYDLPEVP